jgi:penicillin-binding protein 2
MKSGELEKKLKVYSYIIMALFAILLIRLAVVQIFNNDIYQTQAKENRIRLLSIKAPRGEIYSRDGEILATNKLVYTLTLTAQGVHNQDTVINELLKVIAPYYPELDENSIKEKIEANRLRLFEPITLIRDIPWDLVVKIEENRPKLPGVAISVEPLRDYPQGELAGSIMGYIHSITPQEIAAAAEKNIEYDLSSLIGKSGVEKAYEAELRGEPGARRVEVDSRGRPIGELVTLEPEPGNNLYLTIDTEIQKVLEKSMAEVLTNLQKRFPKAQVGSAVVLDVKTREVLGLCSFPAMFPGDWRGNISQERAEYYLGPRDGKYDPLNPGAALNRAIQVTYPPGSTFKPITAMAALEAGVVDPQKDLVNCKGGYWLPPYIKCWGVHGHVNYFSGMAQSCNTFFQEMARRAGKDEIIRVAHEFGLSDRTGIDIPNEAKGLLPTPEWKESINAILTNRKYETLRKELDNKYDQLFAQAATEEARATLERQKKNEQAILEAQYKIDFNFNTNWQDFDTYNMSIGQGSNDYTVIQLANYVATLADDGKLKKPYVVKQVVSPEGKVLKEFKPELIRQADVSQESINTTKQAMQAVCQPGGTSYYLFSHFPQDIKVAAKTGTAESGRVGDDPLKDYHGVFIAFAPVDDPQIAFAGVIEYGYHGGESTGNVAKAVFEQYFGIKDHLMENKE